MGAVCRLFTTFAALNLVVSQGPVFERLERDVGESNHLGFIHATGKVHRHFDPLLTLKNHAFNDELERIRSNTTPAIFSKAEFRGLISPLISKLCSKQATNCTGCASTLSDRVYQILQLSSDDDIGEVHFKQAAVIVLSTLYSDSSLVTACNATGDALGSVGDYLARLTGGLGNPDRLSVEELTAILARLEENYTPETEAKCFDAELLLTDVADREGGATSAEVEHLAFMIMTYMVEGYCIGSATYPDPDLYVENVLSQYGDGEGVLTTQDFESMLGDLGIGGTESDEFHHHVERRAAIYTTGRVDELPRVNTCYSGEELLLSYGLDPDTDIHGDRISLVCPSLLQQQLSGVCHQKGEGSEEEYHVNSTTYLFGVLCVFVISLAAILGGLLIPLLSDENRDLILGMLIAMAVSTLTGDAIIHLIPLATGLHAHDKHDDVDYIWKTFLTVMSLYLFFLFEGLLGVISPTTHNHNHGQSHGHSHGHSHGQLEDPDSALSLQGKPTAPNTSDRETAGDGDVDEADHIGNQVAVTVFKFGSVPVMVLLSDAFHNFCDGLAIGASFAASIGTGLSTSIAVLCHELPHELGDLAMLLKSGMKLKWALLFNFLSALTCFVGFFIGLVVAETLAARQWILAITAGMFIYVGLVDMMPQILHAERSQRPLCTFLLQNVGFLLGVFAMLAISFFEVSVTINI